MYLKARIFIAFTYFTYVADFKNNIILNLYFTYIGKYFFKFSSFKSNPLIVVSKSIVALVSSPTIADIRKPPFKIKLSLYYDNDMRSGNLSSI